ncbi:MULTISPECIES: response regulator transcription factor [Marinomonas]|uniref:Response regulator transcription factor n=1 Tax=Marinomonas arctica TaxID=383750 RepID=A0A7H1J5R7_9GAMM|nr:MULTISPECIES: response regulator transcription factor [Marinomonas]MCS7488380.1 chemotaxis protein CheY [Marinomonas sp. BSi20414]QNT05833.1 response regulator transcription factor [Marinomonas arctica]GGN38211.1 DNA-binding response regulator [Marinomonas arctica]
MRILVVEDDRILGEAISQRIRRMGHGLDLAQTGLQANQMLALQEYDLMLLDLNLPDMSGSHILHTLRKKHSNTPVIVLTARNEIKDRIALLDLGADDYMTKPVDFGELEARCRALLRRSQGQAQNSIEYGNVCLDLQACTVTVAGQLIELKQREFRLLEVFISHTGRVLSKEVLIEHIYSFNENPNPSVIEIYVARLRKSLQDSDISIRTIRGLGYLLEKYHD